MVTQIVFDRETKDDYHINIVCKDQGDPPLVATKYLPVTVLDDNDHKPVFEKEVYNVVMPENNPVDTSIAGMIPPLTILCYSKYADSWPIIPTPDLF